MFTHAFSRSLQRSARTARVASPAPLLALLALAICSLFALAARAQGTDAPKRWAIRSGIDSTIRPGDDFFAYANGAWLKATPIPDGQDRVSARTEIAEVTRQRVARLLDDARTAPAGSAARKVADFRAAYMNTAAIETRGIAPLKPLLDSIDRIRDKPSLTRMLGRTMPADVDPLNYGIYKSSHPLGLSVEESIHGEKRNVAFLVQGGLGLSDREDYIATDAARRSLRAKYLSYIEHQLALAGFDLAAQRAQRVMALETALAESQATIEASSNDHNADTRWTRADFAHQAPGFDWSAFFDAAGLTTQESFVIWQPSAVTGLATLASTQPVEAWKDYLRFHVIDRFADVLPHAFAGQARVIRPTDSTRAQRAISATQLALGEAIGRMYIEKYLPADQKARVQAIVANVQNAFARRVQNVPWMSPESKALAIAKVKKLYIGIGYPDRWQSYADLTVDAADPIGNLRRVSDREYRRALARLNQPWDQKDWLIAPQTPGGILVFQLIIYDFAGALLQSPKWDPTASDAASYGSIGAIIGHDVTHYVDLLGAEFDVDGTERHWWTKSDSLQFEALAVRLDDQFSGYHPFPDAGVNGKLTQSENIADLGGLTAAFDAYRESLGKRAQNKAFVREQDREFFIAFAQAWRSKLSDAAMRKQLTNDHAPEMYRIATVRNLDAWYDAFDVTPGQKLYVDPKLRAHIW